MATLKIVLLAVSYLHFNCFLKLVVELTNLSSLRKEFHSLQDLIKKTLLKMFCTGSWYNEVIVAPCSCDGSFREQISQIAQSRCCICHSDIYV